MKEAEGAHAMQTAQRHVLEEAAQKLMSGQSHAFALAVAAVSVVEGDGALVAGGDGLVGESRAMDVAGEIVR
jgi:diacylglycerol kinase family enzyme